MQAYKLSPLPLPFSFLSFLSSLDLHLFSIHDIHIHINSDVHFHFHIHIHHLPQISHRWNVKSNQSINQSINTNICLSDLTTLLFQISIANCQYSLLHRMNWATRPTMISNDSQRQCEIPRLILRQIPAQGSQSPTQRLSSLRLLAVANHASVAIQRSPFLPATRLPGDQCGVGTGVEVVMLWGQQ